MLAPLRYRSKVRLWKHQERALKQTWKRRSALIWGDVGVGKTKVAVDYACARALKGDVSKVLVVGPLAAVGVWEQEFSQHMPANAMIVSRNDVDRLTDLVSRIHTARSWSDSNKALSIVIITYDALSRYAKLLKEIYVPDLFIIDESHYIKNYAATRTRRALSVSRSSKYVLCLSGTPCPNGYEELYWQLQAVHPGILGATYQEFKRRYCRMGGYMGKEITGYRNKRHLAKQIARVTVRIPKDVLGLPPSIEQVIPLKLDTNARSVYDKFTKELVVELENGASIEAPNQLVLLMRLLQITGGFLDGQQIGEARKLRILTELVTAETEKVVIAAHFVQEIRAIEEALTKAGMRCAVLRGGVKGKERARLVKQFQNDDKLRVMIIQPSAGGISVTLTAASVMYFYSVSYNPEPFEQAKGRIERGGQTKSCRYMYLQALGTVDEEVLSAVRRKLKQQEVLSNIVRRLTKRV